MRHFVEANYHAATGKNILKHWIALMDKKVIASDPDPMKLVARNETEHWIAFPLHRVVSRETDTDLDEDAIASDDLTFPGMPALNRMSIYRRTDLDEDAIIEKFQTVR